MSQERDTHFQGFADLTWDDISKLEFWIDTAEDDIAGQIKQIIAQRAYDLLIHDRMHTGTSDLQSAGSYLEAEEYVNGVPDLMEWPVETSEPKGSNPA